MIVEKPQLLEPVPIPLKNSSRALEAQETRVEVDSKYIRELDSIIP